MAFQTPITIKEAVENIRSKRYLLPSIQRELVWTPQQIERLFDSLMRDYPIGSFLFWQVNRDRVKDFTFYDFVRDYHERDSRHNAKADPSADSDITGVLDGQQRLTSLFIGLVGSYAKKAKAKRWDNDQAFPKRFLHLNLLKEFEHEDLDIDLKYDFRFLTPGEASTLNNENKGTNLWFRIGDILNFDGPGDVSGYLLSALNGVDDPYRTFANNTLFKLYTLITTSPTINYFLEKHGELDKVLNIFVRINSGGTQLSYADLLLSIASASWKNLDAREEILQFVDEISKKGNGFAFNQDFVLKSSLVLSDIQNIRFKVDNFNKGNMQKIEANWPKVTSALRIAVNLVEAFGYRRDTLSSNNALIPIAYYILKKGNPANFVQSAKFAEDRQKIRRWLTASLLKRAFSGQPDNVLRPIRQIIQKDSSQFPLDQIVKEFRGKEKSIVFTDDDIEALFNYGYGDGYTFSTLAVLYPTLDFKNLFHIDHVFPWSFADRKKLTKNGLTEAEATEYIGYVNFLPNLQLLEGTENMEKSNKPFDEWLSSMYPKAAERTAYMDRNYIPDVDLSLKNFNQFYEERLKLMKAKFKELISL